MELWARLVMLVVLGADTATLLCFRPFWDRYVELQEAQKQVRILHHIADRAISRADVAMGAFSISRAQEAVKVLHGLASIQDTPELNAAASKLEATVTGVVVGSIPWFALHPSVPVLQTRLTHLLRSYDSIVLNLYPVLAIMNITAAIVAVLSLRVGK